MNIHKRLCGWGFHWWNTGHRVTSMFDKAGAPFQYCRCCGLRRKQTDV